MHAEEARTSATDAGERALVSRFAASAAARAAESWLPELGRVVTEQRVPLAVVRSAVTDLAWLAREAGAPLSSDVTTHDRTARLLHAYTEGQRLRFDFRFAPLARHATAALEEFPDDALLVAFTACGRLGSGDMEALALVDAALAAPDADVRTRQVCLHALWTAHHSPEAARRTLDLGNGMIARGEADSTVFFRLSSAHRCLGDLRQALECINEGLLRLPAGSNEVNQDYVRERELVILAMQLDGRT